MAVELNSLQGHSRRGVALFNLRRYEDAKQAYEQGLKLDANNAQLKEGLEQANKALHESKENPLGKLFGPQMWTKVWSLFQPPTGCYFVFCQFLCCTVRLLTKYISAHDGPRDEAVPRRPGVRGEAEAVAAEP
jgi:hypothetical protein